VSVIKANEIVAKRRFPISRLAELMPAAEGSVRQFCRADSIQLESEHLKPTELSYGFHLDRR
jgi:hypothetical protein